MAISLSLLLTLGSITENEDIILDFYDLSSSNNGNSLVQELVLNKNSPFFQYTNLAETEFQYVMTARFLDWFKLINGKIYRAELHFLNSSGQTQTTTYSWTMSISGEQEQVIADTTQQEINQGIQDLNNSQQEMNNFLTDSSYQDDMFQLPSAEIEAEALTYGELLYNMLEQAFTNDTAIDFEFIIPFSNGQKIIIPSNYIESHIPSVIVFLIRTFYWYVICRFILKDIIRVIDRLRQGDYFLSSDEDIKTEVL